MISIVRLFSGTALLLLLCSCAMNPATGERDLVFMSEDSEIAMGREYSKQVLAQTAAYDDAELQAYVQEIGDRVAGTSHRNNLFYRFTVLDTPGINAMALPGGYIYINRGLLVHLNSEAELAAVLAHEVGHVTARHSVRQHATGTLAGVFSTAVAIGTGYRQAGDLANLLSTAVVRGYGREMELEADRLGAEYLARAGYDPQSMVQVLRVLKAQEQYAAARAREAGEEFQGYHGLFSTHPDHDTRLQQVVGSAAALGAQTRGDGRKEFHAALEGVEFGDSTQSGVRRGNAFYHEPLGIALRFPTGWRIENLSNAVIGHTVAKDAFVVLTLQDLNKKQSPAEFIRERLGIKELRNAEPLRVDGMEGYTGLLPPGFLGGRQGRVAVLYKDRQAFIFQGQADKNRSYQEVDADVLATVRSFHRLARSEVALARAPRIRLHRVRAGDTYRKLGLASELPNDPEGMLRLLNGQYPDGEPVVGSKIKVVQ